MTKAVFFDFDGTLANTLPYYLKAYGTVLHTFDLAKSEKEIVQSCFGKRVIDTCSSLGIPEKVDEFSTLYFDVVKKSFKDAKLFYDTLETLRYLQNKNIKMAVITFAYRWYIDQMMDQFNLSQFIKVVISADEVTHSKPHPEAILKACSLLETDPKETIVVGDSGSDILMAKAAGSKSALMFPEDYSRYYDFVDLQKTSPDFTIAKISDLIRLV